MSILTARFIHRLNDTGHILTGRFNIWRTSQLATPTRCLSSYDSSVRHGLFVSNVRRGYASKRKSESNLDSDKLASLRDPNQTIQSQSQNQNNELKVKRPDRIERWPTPVLTQHEVEEFLVPLYDRGWAISHVEGKTRYGGLYNVPTLRKFIIIRGGEHVENTFMKILIDLEKSENHHVQLRWSGKRGKGSWFTTQKGPKDYETENMPRSDYPFLTISIHTHSAILPPPIEPSTNTSNNENAKQNESKFEINSRRVSGLTLRDIRFAMLLDERVEEWNAQQDKPEQMLENGASMFIWNPNDEVFVFPDNVEELAEGPREKGHSME
ncbi:uncharacterized protein FOMMEDRAFT_146855 [Fomitiporia mediterranea MF3/22]|uniref:uncharacterized protein n=1 Tax=Fomitiporia mediterranea (strain MF3/22) TaxID=694068 RepID=UPI0004407776|nr:uncharacterized protein FOMMEDRAFT_146855 [Fomitiporia mediterranea MF3/22]EJD03214.1 hypothetical protein FOMMEDRAFT_146855 [Fomitiporia mediterranea MF3/22]